MPRYARVHDDRQRTAIQQAYYERNIRPARRIVELAAAGELTADGELVPAFAAKESTVRDIGRRFSQRRQGARAAPIAHKPAPDAVEALRVRLVSAADALLGDIERRLAARGKRVSAEEIRQAARAVREVAALPELGAGAPAARPAPGAHHPGTGGKAAEGATRGGLAGQVMRAAGGGRRGFEERLDAEHGPAPGRLTSEQGQTENTGPAGGGQHEQSSSSSEEGEEREPGSYVSERIAGLQADSVRIGT